MARAVPTASSVSPCVSPSTTEPLAAFRQPVEEVISERLCTKILGMYDRYRCRSVYIYIYYMCVFLIYIFIYLIQCKYMRYNVV